MYLQLPDGWYAGLLLLSYHSIRIQNRFPGEVFSASKQAGTSLDS